MLQVTSLVEYGSIEMIKQKVLPVNIKVHILVYFELHQDMCLAISREKQLKKWNRKWKLELIEKRNPQWQDLWSEII